MQTSLLVVTPKNSFGELIRQSLSETGTFRVHMAKGKADAILKAEQEECTLALLDMELGEKPLLEIGRSLRRMNSDLDVVILADDELPPSFDAIRPWVLLRKPFYLPDFIQLIQAVSIVPDFLLEDFSESQQAAHKLEQEPLPKKAADEAIHQEIVWLNDVSKAAQHLTRLTLESSAQAALITRENALWAYAGQLSQNAANELATTVSRHWDGQKGNDLLRFVRLESTKAEHMLYATSMTADIILALVFDAETPFSTIRSQANNLAHSLAVAKTGPYPVAFAESTSAPIPEQVEAQSEAEEVETKVTDEIAESADDELEIPSISEILREIPPPVPPAREKVAAASSEPEFDPIVAVTRPSIPMPHHLLSNESSPVVRLEGVVTEDGPTNKNGFLQNVSDGLATTLPSRSQRRRPATPVQRPAPGELDQTRPQLSAEVSAKMMVEPASPAMAQINFSCLLVPRFTIHYMTGDLADRVSEWMPNICIAFGWRLEFLAVRPDYLQWVINVRPNTSPGYLMRIIRQHTSDKIFGEFPRLKRENPSGDFWAPGYLIMGGKEPHPQQLVKDYIKQTRQRQGISQPRR